MSLSWCTWLVYDFYFRLSLKRAMIPLIHVSIIYLFMVYDVSEIDVSMICVFLIFVCMILYFHD